MYRIELLDVTGESFMISDPMDDKTAVRMMNGIYDGSLSSDGCSMILVAGDMVFIPNEVGRNMIFVFMEVKDVGATEQ